MDIEIPNKDLHSFKGIISINGKDFTLSDKQILLKGANLQNTDWVLGICCYTGEESKIMLNSQNGRQKMSHMESKVNKLVIYIILVQALICIMMSVGSQIWQVKSQFDNSWLPDTLSYPERSVVNFFTYFLLMSTLLPISL